MTGSQLTQSPLRDRVIFVVGARRSGTTWLERILTAHPDVVGVPTETYIFSHGVQTFTERLQSANPASPMTGRAFMSRDAFRDAMRYLVDRVLLETVERENPNARYVVERTPWHALHVPLISEIYPDARIVNIVRDGRAVARSLVAMPWGPDSIADAAAEWSDCVEQARTAGQALGDHYLEVVYETLLGDPRRGTGEIFAWLGLELPDETWERILVEAGSEFNVDPASPAIRTDKWRDELSARELRTVEAIAGEQLDAFGYPRAAPESLTADRLAALRPRERLRAAAAFARHPRSAARRSVRKARERSSVQHHHADQIAHHEVVETFERSVADGDQAAARALLTPGLRVRIDEGAGARKIRGDAAADELLTALEDHRTRLAHMRSGQVHATPYGLTTIATYSLADGSEWARTLVYRARARRLAEVGLYRYELKPAPLMQAEPEVSAAPTA